MSKHDCTKSQYATWKIYQYINELFVIKDISKIFIWK